MSKEFIRYELPKGWIWATIEDIGVVVSGSTPDTTEPAYWSGNIPWITPADLTHYKEKYIAKGHRNISVEGLYGSSATLLPKGTVLFSSRAPIGYVAIAQTELATNQGFKSIIPSPIIDSEYLYYYLKSAKGLAESLASGTTFLEISANSFRKLPIPITAINLQRQIVSRVEELYSGLDNSLAIFEKAKAKLELYRVIILLKAFKKTDGSNINADWKKIRLGELFDFIGGGTPSKKQPQFWKGNIPWASVKDIKEKYLASTEDHITEEGLENSSTNIAGKGEVILVTRISPGRTTITKIDVCINQDLKIVKAKSTLNSEFIYYLFEAYEREIFDVSSGTTVKGVSLNQLENLEVLFPPQEEHDLIVKDLNYKNSLIDNFSNQISSAIEQINITKQSILKKAFTGLLVDTYNENLSLNLEDVKKEQVALSSYLKNQSKMTEKVKLSTRPLIEILQSNFRTKTFTYADIQAKAVMSYEDIKEQLFQLIDSEEISVKFDAKSQIITYKFSK